MKSTISTGKAAKLFGVTVTNGLAMGAGRQKDQNAAQNVLARLLDPDIDRFTPFERVKAILLQRT